MCFVQKCVFDFHFIAFPASVMTQSTFYYCMRAYTRNIFIVLPLQFYTEAKKFSNIKTFYICLGSNVTFFLCRKKKVNILLFYFKTIETTLFPFTCCRLYSRCIHYKVLQCTYSYPIKYSIYTILFLSFWISIFCARSSFNTECVSIKKS